MYFKPNFDRILAKKIEKENKTQSGIEFKKVSNIEKAIVLEVASEVEKSCEIEKGDIIFYEPFTAIDLEEENLILIKQIDVLGYEKKN